MMKLMSIGEPQFMRMAIALATNNVVEGRGGPFGAVVVRGGAVVATGVNQVTATNDPTAHAEVVAIRNAGQVIGSYQLWGCEVYTSCEPCPMCLAALYWARCERVFFGNRAEDAAKAGFDDQVLYEEISKAPGERTLPMLRLLPEDARESFALWAASLQKVEY